MALNLTGGCQCGDLLYVLRGAPLSTSICHCASCRRASGAPAVAWGVFDAAAFEITRGRLTEFASSPGVLRGHCARCGTSLTFRETGEATVDVTLASLDDPGALVPEKEIWLEHRIGWMPVDPRRKQHPRGS